MGVCVYCEMLVHNPNKAPADLGPGSAPEVTEGDTPVYPQSPGSIWTEVDLCPAKSVVPNRKLTAVNKCGAGSTTEDDETVYVR